VSDVLEIAYMTKASGSTSPTASLVPYYDRRKVIKTFIIVMDEEENRLRRVCRANRGISFDLFMEYRKTVFIRPR
jgi:hypothetical protein